MDVGKIQVFFKECMQEKVMAKGTEKGRKYWKAESRLGTRKHFLQQNGRASNHL